jgi:hypothetical protein
MKQLPKMQEKDWKNVRYFKKHEFPNWEKTAKSLIFAWDAFRHEAGKPVIIHCAFEPRARGGYHPRGEAADGHVVGMHLLDQFLIAEKLDIFGGIGVYTWWDNPGLHLDVGKAMRRWGSVHAWTEDDDGYRRLDSGFILGIKK